MMRPLLVLVAALTIGCVSADKGAAPAAQANKVKMEKDPVCGMEVDPAKAEKATYEGKTYYFCAREEREAFEKDPVKYAKKN